MNFHAPAINTANAVFPKSYEQAKQALATCESLDECCDWADKAAALASYAKQANDPQLEKMSIRIRARAVRRAGELLKQFDGRATNAQKQTEGTHSLISRRQMAEAAGMSEHQEHQAVRVANVPEPEFTEQVEKRAKPATITELAVQGIKRPLVDLKGRDPSEFNIEMHYVGAVSDCARDLRNLKHDQAIPILTDKARAELRKHIAEIDRICDMIATRI
jgi:hypothetical protein